MRDRRGRELAMIFQDPLTSLNPVFTIGRQLMDVQRAHRRDSGRGDLRQRAIELAIELGLAPQAAEAAIDRALIDRPPALEQTEQDDPLHSERPGDAVG